MIHFENVSKRFPEQAVGGLVEVAGIQVHAEKGDLSDAVHHPERGVELDTVK